MNSHHQDPEMRQPRIKLLGITAATGFLAVVVTLGGLVFSIPWFIMVIFDLPMIVVSIVYLTKIDRPKVFLQWFPGLFLFFSGMMLLGLSLLFSPYSDLGKLLALVSASLAFVCSAIVVIPTLQFDRPVEEWRSRGEPGILQLIETLSNSNAYLRTRAAEILGELGDVRAVEPLMRALEDEESSVRVAAAIALGALGDTRAIPALQRLQEWDTGQPDATRFIRDVATEAIRQIEEQQGAQ